MLHISSGVGILYTHAYHYLQHYLLLTYKYVCLFLTECFVYVAGKFISTSFMPTAFYHKIVGFMSNK